MVASSEADIVQSGGDYCKVSIMDTVKEDRRRAREMSRLFDTIGAAPRLAARTCRNKPWQHFSAGRGYPLGLLKEIDAV